MVSCSFCMAFARPFGAAGAACPVGAAPARSRCAKLLSVKNNPPTTATAASRANHAFLFLEITTNTPFFCAARNCPERRKASQLHHHKPKSLSEQSPGCDGHYSDRLSWTRKAATSISMTALQGRLMARLRVHWEPIPHWHTIFHVAAGGGSFQQISEKRGTFFLR